MPFTPIWVSEEEEKVVFWGKDMGNPRALYIDGLCGSVWGSGRVGLEREEGW